MSGAIRVISPGMLSLVQDSGRSGRQRYGVSVSGAMDRDALQVGNLLVVNEQGAAAVEITFGGASFIFERDSIAAITGADLGATLDGTPISPWESFLAPAGSILSFVAPVAGMRTYLSIAGGIDTEPVLGSRSTHIGSKLGGLTGGPLVAGDIVPVGDASPAAASGLSLPAELRPSYGMDIAVRVVPGPQDDAFTDVGVETFFSSAYTVTDKSDRQGVRLDGPVIEAKEGRYDIVSDAVPVGAIQVPGDGMPIALLADRQTTGGYAKIGVVASVDLPLLGQAMPGTTVHFQRVSVDDARAALVDRHAASMSADLSAGVESLSENFILNGEPVSVEMTLRKGEAVSPAGALVSARINGALRSAIVRKV